MREKIVRRAACEFQHGMYANLGEEKKTSWDSICFPYECEVGWNDIWFFAIFKVKKWHLARLGPKKMIFKEKKYFQKFVQGLSFIHKESVPVFWIRIHYMVDPDLGPHQALFDSDPDPRIQDIVLKKFFPRVRFYFSFFTSFFYPHPSCGSISRSLPYSRSETLQGMC